ncbi:MAG: PhnD/SsuA/transferrin family substrate-binding protein [Geminicoccaceae bacterium]
MVFATRLHNPFPQLARAGVDRGRRAIVLALAGGMTAAASRAARAEEARPVYSFGILPFLPALKVGERFAAAAHDLAEALGARIQLCTKDTVEAYAGRLFAGAYDIVLVHPFLYVEGHELQGYRALARADHQIRAVLFGRKQLAGRRLVDLRGETIAIVPLSAATRLLQEALLDRGLADEGVIRLQPRQTRISCLQAVISGEASGCVMSSRLNDVPPAVDRLDLAKLWESRPIGGLVLAAHPRVPVEDVLRLKERILGWNGTSRGKAILHGLSWPRFVGAEDGDFDAVSATLIRLRGGGPA